MLNPFSVNMNIHSFVLVSFNTLDENPSLIVLGDESFVESIFSKFWAMNCLLNPFSVSFG